MNIYFAGYSTLNKHMARVPEATHLLDSYLYFKNKDFKEYHDKHNIKDRKIFLDSGAFSAFTLNKKIDIDHYIEYIKKNRQYLHIYACLDVIGDAEGTMKNLRYMESKGVNPLPVFHNGSDFKFLEEIVEKYDHFALGGLVPLARDRVRMDAHLNKCFRIITKKFKETGKMPKVHGFGINSFRLWMKYPFHSTDATSWLHGGMSRMKFIFKNNKLKRFTKNVKDKSLDNFLCHQQSYIDLDIENIKEILKAVDFVTRVWEKRGLKF